MLSAMILELVLQHLKTEYSFFFSIEVENVHYHEGACMHIEYAICDNCSIFNNVQIKGMLSPNYLHIT